MFRYYDCLLKQVQKASREIPFLSNNCQFKNVVGKKITFKNSTIKFVFIGNHRTYLKNSEYELNGVGAEEGITKGHEETSRVMEVFIIMIVVLVTWVYACQNLPNCTL